MKKGLIVFLILLAIFIGYRILGGSSVECVDSNEFTIIVLPDTQYYSENNPEIFREQTNWIVNNKDCLNTKIVLHVGDVVERLSVSQFEKASKIISVLDGEVPYLIASGNHDVDRYNNPLFESYFGKDRFLDYSWYSGSYSNGSFNSYSLMEIEGLKFGFLSLGWTNFHSPSTMNWANEMVRNNPEYQFIVNTHSFVDDSSDCLNDQKGKGIDLWNNLVKHHPNIFMIVSGHFYDISEKHCKKEGINGNEIYATLSNYQNETNGGNGKLRYYIFNPSENKIYAHTYSPRLKEYFDDPTSEFILDFDFNRPNQFSESCFEGELCDDNVGLTKRDTCIDNKCVGEIDQGSYTFQKEIFEVNQTILNSKENEINFEFDVLGFSEWANTVTVNPLTFKLIGGESRDVTMLFDIKNGASGKYSFEFIAVAEGNKVLNNKTVSI